MGSVIEWRPTSIYEQANADGQAYGLTEVVANMIIKPLVGRSRPPGAAVAVASLAWGLWPPGPTTGDPETEKTAPTRERT